jgi:hypothetical protein
MKPTYSDLVFHTELMQVGQEVFPVYGDDNSGFSVDIGDFTAKLAPRFRYESRDELFFALVNFNLGKEGNA